MYIRKKSSVAPLLATIPQSPRSPQENDDVISSLSESTWKSASSHKSRYSTASSDTSLNNNPQTRPPTSVVPQHHTSCCHKHGQGHHNCTCLRNFYEDDEVCRINKKGRLEFGIVAKYGNNEKLKVLWTLGETIEEEELDNNEAHLDDNIRLIDRKSIPGDLIHVNKKRGEVLQVCYTCHIQIPEINITLLHIPTDQLQQLVPYYPGQKIYANGWVGTIASVSTEATLMFTGITRTGVIDCSSLPRNNYVYPGRNVSYTVNQYIEAKLRFLDDSRSVSEVFKGQLVVEAFVLFINITDVEVKWNGRINPIGRIKPKKSMSTTSITPPPTSLSKSYMKKHAKVLGTISDIDWESANDDFTNKFFQYTAKESDIAVPTSSVESYLRAKYFEDEKNPISSTTVRDLRKSGSKMCTNVAYNVRILRFSRILRVRWVLSGKIENIPASTVSNKMTLNKPFHELVQKTVSLSSYSYDEFGVTLTRDSNDTVLVQWVTKVRDRVSRSFKYATICQTPEPTFDLEPHFAYGGISPMEIVYRSVYCTVPEPLFTVGWVREIKDNGSIVVVCATTKQDHVVYPPEIEATGMKIDWGNNEVGKDSKFKLTRYSDLVRTHGLNILRNSDKLFVQNLSSYDSRFPDHFTLLPKCPTSHTYYKNQFSVKTDGSWTRAVKKDQTFLTTIMNDEIGSIWIKGFRDRLDLFSVLMAAPAGSPYEGALYSLDIQLVPDYPSCPPAMHVLTRCGGLKPGAHTLEFEHATQPYSIVNSLIDLQTKLFVKQEYLDIPSSAASLHRRNLRQGNKKQKEEQAQNANIIINVLDLMFRSVMDPSPLWAVETVNYFQMSYANTKERLLALLDMTNPYPSDDWIMPSFPLVPISDGFTESVHGRLKRFDELIERGLM